MSKKIIAIIFIVLFSVTLWVFISLSGDYFYNVNLPITFSDIPEGYAVSNTSDEEISISLKGQGWQLAQMTFGSNPEFTIEVADDPGTHEVTIRNALEKNRWLSSTVQINEFSPAKIKYIVEELDEKRVPVEPNVDLEFKNGFGLISELKVEPDSVSVRGPKSLVEEIESVKTNYKNYTAVDKSIIENILLEEIDKIIFSETDRVTIKFDVQKIVDKEFQNIPVEVKNIPPSKDLIVYPEQVNVILRGGINVLGTLDKSKIKVLVNFNQAIRDTIGYLVPEVEVPDFTTFVGSDPDRLEYIIHQL
ncbi:MAG: CdaR family protein [Melioribacteraceae bacterium]|nr:CdaR family protein [Melioribacteraceae bacterium]